MKRITSWIQRAYIRAVLFFIGPAIRSEMERAERKQAERSKAFAAVLQRVQIDGAEILATESRRLKTSELPQKLMRGNSGAQAAFFKDALKHFTPSALEIARRSRMTRSLRRRFARCSREKRELLLFAYRIPSLSSRTERRAARQR